MHLSKLLPLFYIKIILSSSIYPLFCSHALCISPSKAFLHTSLKIFHPHIPLNTSFPFKARPIPYPSLGRLQGLQSSGYFLLSKFLWHETFILCFPPAISTWYSILLCIFTHVFSLPNHIMNPWKTSYFFVLATFKMVLKNIKQTRQVLTTTSFYQIKIYLLFHFPKYYGQCQYITLCF